MARIHPILLWLMLSNNFYYFFRKMMSFQSKQYGTSACLCAVTRAYRSLPRQRNPPPGTDGLCCLLAELLGGNLARLVEEFTLLNYSSQRFTILTSAFVIRRSPVRFRSAAPKLVSQIKGLQASAGSLFSCVQGSGDAVVFPVHEKRRVFNF
jgi:hypothetical protein